MNVKLGENQQGKLCIPIGRKKLSKYLVCSCDQMTFILSVKWE